MSGPIPVPVEDPSTTSRLLNGVAPNGEPIVSVVFGMTFAVARDGKLSGKGYELVAEAEWEKAKTIGRHTRPSLLLRDADIWSWKNFTDVVVQGSVRSDKPIAQTSVDLSVMGGKAQLKQTLQVTGDRWVDRGKTGLVLSEPVKFSEMPLRYDRAYGGTDELAEQRLASEELLNYFVKALDRDENEELSAYSYPRNAAGRGYLIDPDGARGLPWPNLEFPDDKLRLDNLTARLDHWGKRPYPACFDWFHHAWFPRSGHLLGLPVLHDGKVPDAERRLGSFPEGWEKLTLQERAVHHFANGAHPYLCRNRLRGDELVTVTHTSRDGRDFVAQLPGLEPRVSLKLVGESKVVIPGSLDLVFAETEFDQITLVWRATHMTKREHLPADWIARSPYEILW